MNKLIVLSLSWCLLPSLSIADNGFLCKGDKTVGFNVERKFNVTKFPSRAWIIKKSSGTSWAVFEHGKDYPEMYCEHSNPDVFDSLKCDGLYSTLVMSKTTMRFINSWYGQYIYDTSNTENIAIEIGNCLKF